VRFICIHRPELCCEYRISDCYLKFSKRDLKDFTQIITKFLIMSSLKIISFLEVHCTQHLFVNNLKSFSDVFVSSGIFLEGLHMSRHSGHKPPASSVNCCLQSPLMPRTANERNAQRCVISTVLFHLQWRHYGPGRRGSNIFLGHWSITALLSPAATGEPRSTVSVPTSEYRHPA